MLRKNAQSSITSMITDTHKQTKSPLIMELVDQCLKYDVIGIDQGQFFQKIVQFSQFMANKEKIVIIAALDGTFQRNSFNNILNLIPKAEKVIKLSAICAYCTNQAAFTKRLIENKQIELIGGQDIYKPVCRMCYFRSQKENNRDVAVKSAKTEQFQNILYCLTMNLNVKIQLQFLSKMNMLELQRLTRENDKKNGKLISQSTSIDCLKSDLQTQAQIINRQKSELEEAKKEIKSLKRKLQQEEMERERVQGRYLLVLQNLESELEQNKKKYSKLQNKIIPLIDNDTVRLKILNQVQSNHQMQINNLKNSIESLKDEILRLKRENQVLKHVIQNQKLSHQEQIRRLKSNKNQQFAQDTINYLNYAMWREIQTKLKNSYEQARKQADFYKDKYFAVQKKYQAKISMLDREQYESKQDFRKR